ncbi:LysR family transcriptional regulator [Marinobacter zhanjiangensis]|uniref:LysR family transcriptional regulator n=1 Tax=Marinobacter zhanjiangensis TaxID=578215 RepID=A0ABQ3AQ78_9GAMM|nr:LysR family transcriptional regulator [Marinobacter zhanjiangensis]
MPLVRREKGAIRLTPAGQTLSERAQGILEAVDEALKETRTLSSNTDRLRIGFIEYVYFLMSPVGLEDFARLTPELRIEPLDQTDRSPDEALFAEELELAFAAVSNPEDGIWPKDIRVNNIAKESLAIVVQNDHRLAGLAGVGLKDLDKERLVVFSRNHAPTVFDSVLRGLSLYGIVPQVELEVALLQTMLNGVRSFNGVGIVPESIARHDLPGLSVIPLSGPDAPSVTLQILWLKNQEQPNYRVFARWVAKSIELKTGLLPLLTWPDESEVDMSST